jgi:predicted alpha/beta hydrolase family esterase
VNPIGTGTDVFGQLTFAKRNGNERHVTSNLLFREGGNYKEFAPAPRHSRGTSLSNRRALSGRLIMTKQVLFVQGAGEDVHDRWDDKLVESLERELGAGYAVRYPRMPNEDDPRYSDWKAALFGEFDSLQDGAILVGHSVGGTILIHAVGGTILIHALAERLPRPRLGGIFLVAAPFIGEGGWPSADIGPRTDFSKSVPAGVPIFLYHGTEDEIVPVAHVHLYAKAIPHAAVRTCERSNHQLNNDMSQVARDIRSVS